MENSVYKAYLRSFSNQQMYQCISLRNWGAGEMTRTIGRTDERMDYIVTYEIVKWFRGRMRMTAKILAHCQARSRVIFSF